jgi:ABC-type branched-subunit amino acid transport system substrate-binding protein
MAPVFENADRLFTLLNRLVRRPKKGELPHEVKDRDGLPVVCLTGDDQDDLAEGVRRSLNTAEPRRVPHEFIDMSAMWAEVQRTRGVGEFAMSPEWQQAELYRRVLVKLAQEFSSASNGFDRRVRFRRFGLVNWLLEMTYTADEPDPRHDRDMLRRLRDRELQRRPLFGFMRSPHTEVALQTRVPWWAYFFGIHILPLVLFRAWRALGSEYRWLLHQPYMAPRDPGTFSGFALRLTQPRWGGEDPEQVGKLMVNAFLEDLRVAYRRGLWRRRAARRTTYCVAFLKGVSDDNRGRALVRSVIDVRNDTGAFDPLLLVVSSGRTGHGHARVRGLTEDLYEVWKYKLQGAGGGRTADLWYLPVEVARPLSAGDPDYARYEEQVGMASRFTTDRPAAWARRGMTVAAGVVALALVGTVVGVTITSDRHWQKQHCDLSRSNPDAATLQRERTTGECVGVAAHGYAFGATDARLKKTLATIARQNTEADEIHRDAPRRPVVTLVHLSALLSSPGKGQASSALSYARESLQGAASAQRRQLDKRGDSDPVLRIFPASAGSGMRFGPQAVRTIERMMRTDPTIVGVTGLDQSRQATITTIGELTRVGLPMVATTLSADSLDDHSPLYYQVSPQNRREADVAAAYASQLVAKRKVKPEVRIVYSADPTDEYSKNLRDDAAKSFAAHGFTVGKQGYKPSPTPAGTSGFPGAQTVGETACGYGGLVFFAGRAEDFETVLSSSNDSCGSSPPTFLGGDDVARLAADPTRRSAYPRVPYDFVDFTPGAASCEDNSDLYTAMKQLFPEECERVKSTSLDGHAALAFDAVNLYLKAVAQLQDTAPQLPLTPAAVWHALSSIHGGAALDGESGRIDFGGVVDQQVPLDKLISVQRVAGAKPPVQVGFCGLLGRLRESAWCPDKERGAK